MIDECHENNLDLLSGLSFEHDLFHQGSLSDIRLEHVANYESLTYDPVTYEFLFIPAEINQYHEYGAYFIIKVVDTLFLECSLSRIALEVKLQVKLELEP